MSTAAATSPSRTVTVLLWILRAALALVFLGAGATKLMGDAASVEMFDVIGAGQWLRVLVGAAEVAGAVGLLVPRVHVLAATGLALVMLGATVFNLTSLAANPVPTIVLMLLALVVVWASRRRNAMAR